MSLSLLSPFVLFALTLVPIVALLLMVLPRAPRIVVGSLLFWTDAPAETPVATARRLRRLDLPAVLLLAFLALAILAAAGPMLIRSTPTGPAGVLVCDRSPSLLMTDHVPTTRLALLRPRVADFVASLPPDLPLVMELSPESPDETSPTATAAEIAEQVAGLTAAAEPVTDETLRRRLLVWHSLHAAPLVLFTDLSPYDDEHPQPDFVRVVATGADALNVALAEASVAYRDDRPYLLVSIWASPSAAGSVRLDLADASAPYSISLTPGFRSWTAPLDAARLPDDVTLTLDAQAIRDDFIEDNRLRLVRAEGRHWRVACVGRPESSLLRFLRAADAEVYLSDTAATPPPVKIDVTLFVDRLPPEDFAGPAIVVNPPASVGPLIRTSRLGGPSGMKVVDAASPLAANLPVAGPDVDAFPVFQLSDDARAVLAAGSGEPLVAAWRAGNGSPRVAVLFDLSRENSRWVDQPGFVIFLANTLTALVPDAPRVTRYDVVPPPAVGLGEIEGRQVTGPAIDQSAAAREAFLVHRGSVYPAVLLLWPLLAGLAVVALLLRLALVR